MSLIDDIESAFNKTSKVLEILEHADDLGDSLLKKKQPPETGENGDPKDEDQNEKRSSNNS